MSLVRPVVQPLTRPLTRPLTSPGAGGGGGFSPITLSPAAWYKLSDPATTFQDSAGTTPAVQTDPLGRINDKSGNGAHATQASAALRPLLATGYRLRGDFVDDFISASIPVSDGEEWVNTPWGHYNTRVSENGTRRLPLNDATEIVVVNGSITPEQRTALGDYFGTGRKYMVCLSPSTTISNLRIYSGGLATDILFVGANGATVTKSLSSSGDSSFDVSLDGLTAPVACVWSESLLANTALIDFRCNSNNLTGSIPDLSAHAALANFRCQSNNLTGSIPDLSANTALATFYCGNNQLTGWGGGTVSATLGNFQAQNNLLPAAAVNAILAAFVAAGRTSASGTCILNLGGTGNAAPTGQGITDKATLVSRGWTVTTN